MERQAASAVRYDKTAKPKAELVDGQPVRLYNKDKRRWEPAVVTGQASTPRSYYVQRMSGGVPLRRNRVHLKSTRENFSRAQVQQDDEEEEVLERPVVGSGNVVTNNDIVAPAPAGGNAAVATSSPLVPRRSGRIRNATDFYEAPEAP